MVQRWPGNQSRGAPQLHRGGAEAGNCSGEMIQGRCRSLCVYLCTVLLFTVDLSAFICIYECKRTTYTYRDARILHLFLSVFHFSVSPPDEKQKSQITPEIHKNILVCIQSCFFFDKSPFMMSHSHISLQFCPLL